ncbi:hypothetical protein ACYZT7_21765 [Pseudomonas sp. RT4P38]
MKRDIFLELVEGFDALAAERLLPVGNPRSLRIGAMKGKLVLPEDVDAPLPDDMLSAFEGT